MDAYARAQPANKLKAKRHGPFRLVKLIGKSAVKVELPEHVQAHPVAHASHTAPWHDQPRDIGKEIVEPPAPAPTKHGDEMEAEAILDHRRRGRGCQLLTFMKGQPRHDAE